MDIASYLVKLIQTNKEVGLPELGTFFKKKSPGRYDAELHSFLPPGHVLTFKQEVTEEELLSDYISKEHQISAASAFYYRDQFISKLKQELDETGEATITGLGKLSKSGHLITFEADPHANLGFDFYGLPEIKEQELLTPEEILSPEAVAVEHLIEEENSGHQPEENIDHHAPETTEAEEEKHSEAIDQTPEKAEEQPAPQAEEEQVYEEISEAPAAPEPVPAPEPEPIVAETHIPVEKPSFYKEPEYVPEEPKSGTPAYLKVILGVLVALIILMILFLLKPEWFDRLTGNNAAPEQTVLPKIVPKDTLTKKTDSIPLSDTLKTDSTKTLAPQTAPVKEPVSKNVTPAATPAVLPEGTTYEVIGSSVYGEKAAKDFIAYMKRQWGIDAKIVDQRPGKKIKISIASFKDETTARAERTRLEGKIKITGLYIYTDTHKSK